MAVFNCECDDANPSRTLAQLRTDLMRRLGFSAMTASPPPGMPELLNSFLQGAQRYLYQEYTVLRTERFFTWNLVPGERFYDVADNDESRMLPTPVNAAFSTAGAGGTLAAGTYYYRVSAINANGETLASAETSQVTVGATSTVTVNWTAVTAPLGASPVTGYRIYGRSQGAELLLATVGLVTTFTDTGALTPAGALPTANTTALCPRALDPRKITWVGLSDGDECWRPLVCGIPPEYYTQPAVTGWPERYEIRQCIELWPAPDDANLRLRIKGHFGLEPFDADTDQCTIDDEAVFLFALARAKAHYRQPDAANYEADATAYIRNLVAGSHQTRRYVPGETVAAPLPKPVWVPKVYP